MDVVSHWLRDDSCIDVACPVAVKLYNQNISWVDLAVQMYKSQVDQELGGTCSCSGFLDLSIINACILESVNLNHVPHIAKTR